MKKTLFAALSICVALGSCDSNKNTNSTYQTDILGEWIIVEAGEMSTDSIEQKPFIHFTDSGTVNGYSAVNNFFGNYTTSNDSISFSQIGITSMMGSDMDMNIETAIVDALNNSKTIALEGEMLLVKNTEGKVIMTLKRN